MECLPKLWIQRRPSVDVGLVSLDWIGTILAMATSRLSDWGTGECRPVLDRAQFRDSCALSSVAH